jgi:DNA-binding GntR family transcriptional regulator
MSKAADKAYEKIGSLILEGHFKPGDRLSEEELSRLSGVSRTPVREALRRLAAEYFVVIRPNQGAAVAVWSKRDIEDLFHMRAMLEGMAAARAAKRRSDECLKLMEECVRTIDHALESGGHPDVETFLDENRKFHGLVLEAAGSPRLSASISNLIAPAVVSQTAQNFSVSDLKRSNAHHRDLVGAMRDQDSDLADSIMKMHIRAAASSYLAMLA